eukprot:8381377-Pyramimonas_sp.AAC.1
MSEEVRGGQRGSVACTVSSPRANRQGAKSRVRGGQRESAACAVSSPRASIHTGPACYTGVL